MVDSESRERLRERRAQVQKLRDDDRLRASRGVTLAGIVAHALGRPISIDNFDRSGEPVSVDWPADIRNSPGLVAAYIRRSDASDLLQCMRGVLRALDGRIGFHDATYLGYANARDVDPMSLLAIAERSEDSVVFQSFAPSGVVMVDCYPGQPFDPFSIVVQGGCLVEQVRACF